MAVALVDAKVLDNLITSMADQTINYAKSTHILWLVNSTPAKQHKDNKRRYKGTMLVLQNVAKKHLNRWRMALTCALL